MLRTVDSAALEANFAAIKGAIGCDRVAEIETHLKPSGQDRLVGNCPLTDHDEKTPSFMCYKGASGIYDSWHCYGCNRGGDVIDLYEGVMGWGKNSASTLHLLAERFGYKLSRAEDFMSRNQLMIQKARIKAEKRLETYFNSVVYRASILPLILEIRDDKARAKEAERCCKILGLA